jgi:hypothetical protein
MEPERFPLSWLQRFDPKRPVRFRATVYRGHFEQGGTPIVRDAPVEVTRAIVQHRLDRREPHPPEARYVLVGAEHEAFLVHRLAGAPEFDEIVAVEAAPGALAGVDIEGGVTAVLSGRRADAPLTPGEDIAVSVEGRADTLRLHVRRTIYLGFDDLAAEP